MPPELSKQPTPSAPRVALWARALHALPNRKFASTAEAYRRGALAAPAQINDAVAANLEFTWRLYGRMLRMRSRVGRQALLGSVSVERGDLLQRALTRGPGVVLVSAHLGEFDLAGAWLSQQAGCQVVAVVETVAQARRQTAFDDARRTSGVILRRRAETRLSDLVGDLERGRVVLIMVDRASPSVTVLARLLGVPAQLSVAPHELSRRTGAPVLTATTTTRSPRERVAHFGALYQASDDPSAQELLTALSDEIGQHIRACPWQWHVPADPRQLPFVPGQHATTASHARQTGQGMQDHGPGAPRMARARAAMHDADSEA